MRQIGVRRPPRPRQGAGHEDSGPPAALRTAAEWTSLIVSAIIVFGLAAYLLIESRRPESDHVPAHVRVRTDQARQVGRQYVLPVEVFNRGRRTLRELSLEVTYTSREGQDEQREVLLDYVGEGSRETVYLYLDSDPAKLDVRAQPLFYRME
jgi:uncharacterized protein (TIGR02588 family)